MRNEMNMIGKDTHSHVFERVHLDTRTSAPTNNRSPTVRCTASMNGYGTKIATSPGDSGVTAAATPDAKSTASCIVVGFIFQLPVMKGFRWCCVAAHNATRELCGAGNNRQLDPTVPGSCGRHVSSAWINGTTYSSMKTIVVLTAFMVTVTLVLCWTKESEDIATLFAIVRPNAFLAVPMPVPKCVTVMTQV